MSEIIEIENELKALIIDSLGLEDISPAEINSEDPLFNDGLGLDSIDALELGMAVSKRFKIKLSEDSSENKDYFASVSTLAQFIQTKLGES